MGALFVNDGENEKGRTRRVDADTKNAMEAACNDILNYRMQAGKTYRSEKLIASEWPELRQQIDRRFYERTGLRLHESKNRWTDDQIKESYVYVGKYGWKERKNGEAVVSELPLFGEIDGGVIVYAFTGVIATKPGRFIKIGYTSQNINEYLAAKRLQHDPKLIATTPGDEDLERVYHRKWNHRLADGREWFWPEVDLVSWIEREFESIKTGFWDHFREAQESHGGRYATNTLA